MSAGIAVISGSGSGIGRQVALRLGAEGWDIAGIDLQAELAEETAEKVRALGMRSVGCVADISDDDAVERACRRIDSELGAPRVLVNSAGWDQVTPFAETTAELRSRIVQVNLIGTMNLTHAVLRRMLAAGSGGRVVTIASDAGRVGFAGGAVYAGTKGGLIAFTKSIALECARAQITANCLCPGLTNTPMMANVDPQRRARMERKIPLGRVGEPEEIAAAVAFLAGPEAGYITGQTLSVSGGNTMV